MTLDVKNDELQRLESTAEEKRRPLHYLLNPFSELVIACRVACRDRAEQETVMLFPAFAVP